jgi:Ca2+-transporting ATPase
MFLLLFLASAIYLAIGDLGEGAFLTAGAGLAVALVVFQEARSERALRALRSLAAPVVRVIRDGQEQTRPSRELVSGDVILIGEGDRLPADARLIRGDSLGVDESILTGESAPVDRFVSADQTPAGKDEDDKSRLLGGTLVIRGHGQAEITATGRRTTLGALSASMIGIEFEPTPLQRRSASLIAMLGSVAILFCIAVALIDGWIRGDWIDAVLSGVTVAVALVPEEFPMVLAVFMALGAWRLARKRVLVRRSAVIETLGGAGVLCVDKTGTLTENQMEVSRIWTPDRPDPVAIGTDGEAGRDLLKIAALASRRDTADPMDRAVLRQTPLGNEDADRVVCLRSWPLVASRLAVIQLWREGRGQIAAAKGAPETIFDMCALGDVDRASAMRVLEGLAASGLRILAVALWRGDAFPDPDREMANFSFCGLIGFLDPLRPGSKEAIREAREAGIDVVMITGDYAPTAMEIARQAGLDGSQGFMTGRDLEELSDEDLVRRVRSVRVFARVLPEQKLRLVRALRQTGVVVAMTGDGVNDAPALEAADIGIAMGMRGSDVAREAADIVLLDDGLPSIVGGVRLGRRIFVNLRKALMFITSVHIPIAGLSLLPLLIGLPPLMYPMHVVLLELVIDPVCSLVFEAEPSEPDAMRRPPRRPQEALFGPRQLSTATLQGLVIFGCIMGIYVVWNQRASQEEARGVAFVSLILASLALAVVDSFGRGTPLFHQGRLIFWVIAMGISSLVLVIFATPELAAVFKVAWPTSPEAWWSLALAGVAGGWRGAVPPPLRSDAAPVSRR